MLLASASRRRFLVGASLVCAFVALVLADAAWAVPQLPVIAGTLAAAATAFVAARAGFGAGSTSAHGTVQVDSFGRIAIRPVHHALKQRDPAAAGLPRALIGDGPNAGDCVAFAVCICPLFVALRTVGGARAVVWCDSLPRVGFRRLVVAARWGAVAVRPGQLAR